MATTQTEVQLLVTAKDEASAKLKQVGGSMEGLKKVGLALGASMAAAGAAAVAFGVSSVKSFNESQKVAAQLDAVLKSTGGAAGVTRDAALSLSAALQKQTTYSDEAVLSAENMLLTFTNVKDNVFPEATRTILDMSTALGQDTKASAIQLGKALNDPINGITALRRVGVSFTDAQQKQIETLVKSGKTMEAQKMILKELSSEFGGSAAAQADTFEGKLRQLNNAFDDMKESVGAVLVDAMTPFVNKLAQGVAALPAMWESGNNALKSFMSNTNSVWVLMRDDIFPIFKFFGESIAKSWGEIVKAFEPLRPQLEWFAKIFGAALLGAIIAIAVGLGAVITALIKLAAIIISTVSGAIQGMTNIFTGFFLLFTKANNEAAGSFKKVWDGVRGYFVSIFHGMFDSLLASIKPTIDLINKVIARYNDLPGTKNIPEIRLSGKQFGGPVQSGMSYIVGEKRPEIFTPSQTGNIRQMGQASSGTGGVVVTFNNVQVRSQNDLQDIIAAVKSTLAREQKLAAAGVRTL